MKLCLAAMLGFRPLDRIQLNDREQIRDMHIGLRHGFRHPLPFLYFQRVVGDRIELCSPGGYVTRALPEDVCSHIPAAPVIVQAMPRERYHERLRLPLAERQQSPPAEWYESAYVLAVDKDRWGRVSRAWVSFLDGCHNSPDRQVASISDESKRMLSAIARRDRMPVITSAGGANYSADRGVSRAEGLDADVVRRFIRSALKGHGMGVKLLSASGCDPVSVAKMNRLGIPL